MDFNLRTARLFLMAAAILPQVARAADAPPTAGRIEQSQRPFVHPGMLHNEADFQRMAAQVKTGAEPWHSGWQNLVANRHAQLSYQPHPVTVVYRGWGRNVPRENYHLLYRDAAAAYACALRWKISGDRRYAEKAVQILNAWGTSLEKIDGTSDRFLAAGIYGYQLANAAELVRDFDGFHPDHFARFQQMMLRVFYPLNKDFLERHNGAPIHHYWANWDLCNMASMMSIGILCDQRPIYDAAIDYFKNGGGNGALKHAVWFIHPNGLGQWQESGRDQGHATLGVALMGACCEMAWKQGDDLYGLDNNRFLAGCEYIAKYNLGEEVPYKEYVWGKTQLTEISPHGRGHLRPVWAVVYNHYVKRRGLSAPYTTRMMQKVQPEGGGGDYGHTSGGFDQLGYGTLTATLP